MKKRISKKIKTKKNKDRMEDIFSHLSKTVTIKKKEYQSGYFIFPSDPYAICHFRINETPDWKYGIWLTASGFRLFGEHEELINKFKPSATYIEERDSVDGFLQSVLKIKQNPKLFFVDSLTYGKAMKPYEKISFEDGTSHYQGYQVLTKYNESTKLWDIFERDESITQEDFVHQEHAKFYQEKEEAAKKEETEKKLVFHFFQELPKSLPNTVSLGVFDGNKDGVERFPRYDLRLACLPEVSDNQVDEIYEKAEKLIVSFREKHSYFTSHDFHFEGCYDSPNAIKDCDYTFNA